MKVAFVFGLYFSLVQSIFAKRLPRRYARNVEPEDNVLEEVSIDEALLEERGLEYSYSMSMPMKSRPGMKSPQMKNHHPAKVPPMKVPPMKAPSQNRTQMPTFFSVLNAGQEKPSCVSDALGNAVITYDAYDMMLCLYLGYQGLSGPETPPAPGVGSSHIHGPAMLGETAPILIKLNATNPKTECHSLTTEEEDYLYSYQLYLNVHTVKCPGGEIRGQVLMV